LWNSAKVVLEGNFQFEDVFKKILRVKDEAECLPAMCEDLHSKTSNTKEKEGLKSSSKLPL
jgi:hypothetical protein